MSNDQIGVSLVAVNRNNGLANGGSEVTNAKRTLPRLLEGGLTKGAMTNRRGMQTARILRTSLHMSSIGFIFIDHQADPAGL